jgi:nucleoporin POM152
MLFLAIDRPSVISLRSVTDKRGDKFHLAPHRETVIIECPTGGDFVNVEEDKVAKTPVKTQQRCVGQEDTMQIQVRGVGAMKAAWRKRSKRAVTTGVIEGIEPVPPTTQADDTGALVLSRLDRVAQTHTVPLRIEHDAPGVYSISVTGVSDSMHNSYVPEGREYAFDVHARPAVRFDCPRAIKILENRTAELNFKVESLDGPGQMGDVQLSYEYELADGSIGGDTVKVHGNKGAITAKQAGVYKLVDVSATCSGQIQEPASCRVELIPVPTVELGVNTVREWCVPPMTNADSSAMDVGVTVSFDFTGQPPFSVEYTEQRNGGKTTTRRHRVETKHGDIVLMPEYEGTWTYVCD